MSSSRKALAALAAAVVILSSCTSSQGTPNPSEPASPGSGATPEVTSGPTARTCPIDDELVIAQSASLQWVDPLVTYLQNSDVSIEYELYDQLAFRMPDLSIKPALAESWQWEKEGGLTWLVKMRQGLKFSNGEPIDGAALKWAVDKVVVPGFQSYPFLFSTLASAELVDPYTVRLTTKTPRATLPTLLTQFSLVPPKYYDEVGPEGWVKAPVGSGPYKFVEWVKDSHITLEANPDYWNDDRRPCFNRVTYRFIPDEGSMIAAIKTGEVDVVGSISPDAAAQLDGADGVTVNSARSFRSVFLRLFPDSPEGGGAPLADVRVRQALQYAIDLDTMNKDLEGGDAFLQNGTIMTPDLAGYDDSLVRRPYDPAKAKELLAEAGYPNGFELNFSTFTNGTPKNAPQIAQAVSKYLADVGITAKVQEIEFQSEQNRSNNKTISPMHIWSWGASQLDCRDKFWGVNHPISNSSFLNDAEIGTLIDQLDAASDQEVRNAKCTELQHQLYEKSYVTPLWMMPVRYPVAEGLSWAPRGDEFVLAWEVKPSN